MCILGKVLGSYGETIKLHLEIDKEQQTSKAYPYVWAPDTGSVMYCMPQKGTTVSLYFPNEDETNAIAVNCIRENGSDCSSMENPQDRMFTTEHKKHMYMKPDSLGFDTEETGHEVAINDENGINIKSAKSIYMYARDGIIIKAESFIMDTPANIDLIRRIGEGR